MTDHAAPSKPDLKQGIALADLVDGRPVAGTVDGEDAILVRSGGELFAIGGQCSHYHAPLAEGLVVGDSVRCPWHHACFSLRTGEAARPPAFDPLPCWRVESAGEKAYVREKVTASAPSKPVEAPASVVIVGGGAAGLAAADMLRRLGYPGEVTILSADTAPPVDRPNLSKDYLAGTAPADWIPLRPPEFYAERRIELVLGARVASIDTAARRVVMENGESRGYGALVLATGADPVKLEIPGAAAESIHYLRSFADSQAIVARAAAAKQVVVIGASFIGLEAAASLRARGIEVHVVAPESQPLERILGAAVGQLVRSIHEQHGVVFHLGQTVTRLDGRKATLSGGSTLDADFLVLGVGVRPSVALAEKAGLAVDKGVVVDAYLRTSVPSVYAVGDIARWPDPHTGDRIRVEHWVVAERQGQTAARNILGFRERFEAVPFFWSQHYDVAINYVGHAERWDTIEIDGELGAKDATVTYQQGGRTLAVATVFRDLASLEAEAAMERAAAR